MSSLDEIRTEGMAEESGDLIIGAKIREARREHRLTLKALAERLSISIGLLSQLERGQSSPSVRLLRQICHELQLDGSQFFRAEERVGSDSDHTIVRLASRRKLNFKDQNVTKFKLTPDEPAPLEGYMIELTGGGNSGDQMYSHPGWEFGLVLEGRIRIHLEDKVVELDAGDSFRFQSTRAHRWENGWSGASKVIWVLNTEFYV